MGPHGAVLGEREHATPRVRRSISEEPRAHARNLRRPSRPMLPVAGLPHPFDRWIAGDAQGDSAQEIEGFRLFTGKGIARMSQRMGVHRSAFHDIGLASDDRGRGRMLGLEADGARRSRRRACVKTARRALTCMDGSLATLARGSASISERVVNRPTTVARSDDGQYTGYPDPEITARRADRVLRHAHRGRSVAGPCSRRRPETRFRPAEHVNQCAARPGIKPDHSP